MTEPIETEMPDMSGAEQGAEEGLPKSTQHCPYCNHQREVQQVVDGADPGLAVPVYSCLTCGCEFVVPAS